MLGAKFFRNGTSSEATMHGAPRELACTTLSVNTPETRQNKNTRGVTLKRAARYSVMHPKVVYAYGKKIMERLSRHWTVDGWHAASIIDTRRGQTSDQIVHTPTS